MGDQSSGSSVTLVFGSSGNQSCIVLFEGGGWCIFFERGG